MEKRYQVFISSTKEDLEDARQEVSQALLRANCFPSAMELFPAIGETLPYIKEVIRESDYYIVISAGKYGSIDSETGKSYTELEYDYAMEIGKPIIRLLHKNPLEKLTGDKLEHEPDRRAALEQFRKRLTETHLARFWEEPAQLTAEVVFGLQDAQKRHPATGWVREEPNIEEIKAATENIFDAGPYSWFQFGLLCQKISKRLGCDRHVSGNIVYRLVREGHLKEDKRGKIEIIRSNPH